MSPIVKNIFSHKSCLFFHLKMISLWSNNPHSYKIAKYFLKKASEFHQKIARESMEPKKHLFTKFKIYFNHLILVINANEY